MGMHEYNPKFLQLNADEERNIVRQQLRHLSDDVSTQNMDE